MEESEQENWYQKECVAGGWLINWSICRIVDGFPARTIIDFSCSALFTLFQSIELNAFFLQYFIYNKEKNWLAFAVPHLGWVSLLLLLLPKNCILIIHSNEIKASGLHAQVAFDFLYAALFFVFRVSIVVHSPRNLVLLYIFLFVY